MQSGSTLSETLGFDIDPLVLHVRAPEVYPFLLESAASGTAQGRYDILFAFPGETLRLDGDGKLSGPDGIESDQFLDAFDEWFAAAQTASDNTQDSQLPFSGGWFTYLSYELAAEVEPSLCLPGNPGAPIAFATRINAAVLRDRSNGTVTLVADTPAQLEKLKQDVMSAKAATLPEAHAVRVEVDEEEPDVFLQAVRTAKQYIKDGDIFQANLSRMWRGRPAETVEPWELYAQLREANPAPFAGLAVHDGFAVISSSPERLISCNGDTVETRPIAGTRPRTSSAPISQEQLDDFVSNPKERAEHVMLIDLERNDLGRICVGGSVQVSEFMAIESYTHVHHIVSNVVGEKRPDVTPGQMIKAVFPGGTITGCPKVRCMEVIAELENRPRGAYTGSMGFINTDGSGDLNILIRTMTLNNGELTLAAGSGIVADSDPASELAETRAKAKGLLLSLSAERDSANG